LGGANDGSSLDTAGGGDVMNTDRAAADGETLNEVRLRGRAAIAATSRTLPSGDIVVTSRLIIERDATARRRSAQRVDTIDCIGWSRRVQRSMLGWESGDVVEVVGAIRRRFYRDAGGPVSRVEVEVRSARTIRERRPRGRHQPRTQRNGPGR
jgi:single-strand DNA-binding protein